MTKIQDQPSCPKGHSGVEEECIFTAENTKAAEIKTLFIISAKGDRIESYFPLTRFLLGVLRALCGDINKKSIFKINTSRR
jgi:hypothetical protein